MTRTSISMLGSLLLLASPAMGGELLDQARLMFQPIPATPPALDRGPTAAQKVALGKMLFFEPRLSQSHNIACSSCHNLGLGGGDALETSLGHRSQHGGRNAPTVLNAPFNTAQFWDGRAKDLQEQAGGPLVNPIEMAMTPAHVLEQLGGIPGYVQAFHAAFPGTTEPVTLTNVAQSIAAFEATLITPNAPFDRYLRGDAMALSPEQQAGLRLFMEDG